MDVAEAVTAIRTEAERIERECGAAAAERYLVNAAADLALHGAMPWEVAPLDEALEQLRAATPAPGE